MEGFFSIFLGTVPFEPYTLHFEFGRHFYSLSIALKPKETYIG
jgi:hypothetical protein